MKPLSELGISPAPWRMSPTVGDVENTITENFETHDNTICSCWGTMQEMAANARLIAAAPKLYEALRILLETIDGLGFQPILEGDPLAVAVKCGQVALAEASGESEVAE